MHNDNYPQKNDTLKVLKMKISQFVLKKYCHKHQILRYLKNSFKQKNIRITFVRVHWKILPQQWKTNSNKTTE